MAELMHDLKDKVTGKVSELKSKVQSKKSGSGTEAEVGTSAPAFEAGTSGGGSAPGAEMTSSGTGTGTGQYREPLPGFDANPASGGGLTEMAPQGLAPGAPDSARRELDPTVGESRGGADTMARGPPTSGFGTSGALGKTSGTGTDYQDASQQAVTEGGETQPASAMDPSAFTTSSRDLQSGSGTTGGGVGEAAFHPTSGELQEQAAHLHHPSQIHDASGVDTAALAAGDGGAHPTSSQLQQQAGQLQHSSQIHDASGPNTAGGDLSTSGILAGQTSGSLPSDFTGGDLSNTAGGAAGGGFASKDISGTTQGQQPSGGAFGELPTGGNTSGASGTGGSNARDIREVLDRIGTTDQTGFYLSNTNQNQQS